MAEHEDNTNPLQIVEHDGNRSPRVEPPVEPRVEPQVEPRVEQRVEPGVERRVQPPVEPRVEPQVEQRVEPGVERRVQPPVEPRVEPQVEPRVEPRIEQQVEPRAEQRPVVLALDCTGIEQLRRRRQNPPRQTVPRNPRPPLATAFIPFVLTVNAGQDIVETIRAFFENNRPNFPPNSGALSVEGRIRSAVGDVSNPRIDIQGSPTLFEGLYSILTLFGSYIIPNEGPVQLDSLMIAIQNNDHSAGGSVVGPLIAGCDIEVVVGFYQEGDGN